MGWVGLVLLVVGLFVCFSFLRWMLRQWISESIFWLVTKQTKMPKQKHKTMGLNAFYKARTQFPLFYWLVLLNYLIFLFWVLDMNISQEFVVNSSLSQILRVYSPIMHRGEMKHWPVFTSPHWAVWCVLLLSMCYKDKERTQAGFLRICLQSGLPGR